jgi:hypothetical protein
MLQQAIIQEIPVNPGIPCLGDKICGFWAEMVKSTVAVKQFPAEFPAAGNCWESHRGAKSMEFLVGKQLTEIRATPKPMRRSVSQKGSPYLCRYWTLIMYTSEQSLATCIFAGQPLG